MKFLQVRNRRSTSSNPFHHHQTFKMKNQEYKIEAITTGDIQNIAVDLSRFDKAKAVVSTAKELLTEALIINSKEDQDWSLRVLKDTAVVVKQIEAKRKELVGPFNDAVKKINGYAKDLSSEVEELIGKGKNAVMAFQKAEEEKARQAMITARQGQLAQLGITYDANSNMYFLNGEPQCSQRELEMLSADMWQSCIDAFVEKIRSKSEQQVAQLEEEKELLEAFGSDDEKAAHSQKIAEAVNLGTAVANGATTLPVNGHKVDTVKGTTKRWVFEVTDPNAVPREYLEVNETAIRKAVQGGIREIPGVRIYQDTSLSLR